MPWVNVLTTRKLAQSELGVINTGITAALVAHAGKRPVDVFLTVARPEAFLWGGEKSDNAAIFEVRWLGEFNLEAKRAITRVVATEIAPSVGLDPDRVRVIFATYATADWGRNRGDYS